jgi:hypothetical protein
MRRTSRNSGWFPLAGILLLLVTVPAHAQQITTTIEFKDLPFPDGTNLTNEFEAQGLLFSNDDTRMDPAFPCPSSGWAENYVQQGIVFNLYRLEFVTPDPVTQVTVRFSDNNLHNQVHGLYELDENLQIVQSVFFDESFKQVYDFALTLDNPNGIAGIAACEQPEGAEGLLSITFTTSPGNMAPDCSAAVASPIMVWPPNGKLVPISIQGVTDPDNDPVTLAVTGVHQDEPLSRIGAADATGIGKPVVSIRADRVGKGDGRVYHLSFEAFDPSGASCAGTVQVCVPHDQRTGRTCGDGGPLFDSTGPGG